MMSALQVIEASEERPTLALELPDGTTFGEWLGIGRKLRLGSQALNWHIGDWWKFGVSHWGEDETRKSALEIWGVEGETARVYGWVATKFEPVSRLTSLSFSHYQEAASLPEPQAKELLNLAERENLSKNQLRRQVQAIKAANDPERAEAPRRVAEPEQPQSRQGYSNSALAEITRLYGIIMEAYDALEKERPLTKREHRLFEEAKRAFLSAHSKSEAGPPPADFDIVFREFGRLECEERYNVARITVNRWLLERGKSRLIKERADFVRFQRASGNQVAHDPDVDVQPIDEKLYGLARHAAQFLRVSRYGGWTVTDNYDGTWLVGTVRKTSDELIAMAERQGFEAEAYRVDRAEA